MFEAPRDRRPSGLERGRVGAHPLCGGLPRSGDFCAHGGLAAAQPFPAHGPELEAKQPEVWSRRAEGPTEAWAQLRGPMHMVGHRALTAPHPGAQRVPRIPFRGKNAATAGQSL